MGEGGVGARQEEEEKGDHVAPLPALGTGDNSGHVSPSGAAASRRESVALTGHAISSLPVKRVFKKNAFSN